MSINKRYLTVCVIFFSFTISMAVLAADKGELNKLPNTRGDRVVPPLPIECQSTVVKGCVGECSSSFSATHVVTKKDVKSSIGSDIAAFCLQPVENSLCPNTDALFALSHNGQVVSKGDLTDGDKGFVAGRVGDVITLDVNLVSNSNDIACIRLGETYFNMGYINWTF